MKWQMYEFTITDDKSAVDIETVHRLLRESYWANTRTKEALATCIEHSLCFSVFCDSEQIGFARAVTDYAVFTWIADVIVDPRFRGRGLGKFLMRCVLEHPALRSTKKLLRTRDAHGLYEQFGFTRTQCMERLPDVNFVSSLE